MLPTSKRSSLFHHSICNEWEKFYNIETWPESPEQELDRDNVLPSYRNEKLLVSINHRTTFRILLPTISLPEVFGPQADLQIRVSVSCRSIQLPAAFLAWAQNTFQHLSLFWDRFWFAVLPRTLYLPFFGWLFLC
jgi:hypothetical protein